MINPKTTTILVVDDVLDNLQILTTILKKQGYKVKKAIDGETALIACKSSLPDLMLLDIKMADMDGYEVCKKIKNNPDSQDIPVIFISALNAVFNKVKAFKVGGCDYITKPFEEEEVLIRVSHQLKIQQQKRLLEAEKEKRVGLGQLIAGVADELNTPLDAISIFAQNVAKFLDQSLERLPKLFQSFSIEDSTVFLALLERSLQNQSTFSTKEERKFKKALKRELEAYEIDGADFIVDRLAIMGIYDEINVFVSLLKRPDSFQILEIAAKLSELKRATATINTSTAQASKVVFALKTYARYNQSVEKTIANLTDGIETVLTLYQNQLKHGVEVIKNYAEIPPILCYPDELNRVWTNLVHNALQAMDNKGTLTIDVTQVDRQAKISITDSGRGIPAEIQGKIFEPFFTTKPPGEGSGLGLELVKQIIDKHSGKITVESQPGRTTFNVFIPLGSDEK